MNIRLVKQGASITFYNGVYMFFLGVFFVFFYNFIMKMNFQAIYQLWGFYTRYNSDISYLFILFTILIGIFLLSIGIFICYLSDFIYKRKEKFTWIILFISGILSWGGILTMMILLKNIILIALTFIGWAWFIIGMLIPISYYMQKEYKEY